MCVYIYILTHSYTKQYRQTAPRLVSMNIHTMYVIPCIYIHKISHKYIYMYVIYTHILTYTYAYTKQYRQTAPRLVSMTSKIKMTTTKAMTEAVLALK